MISQSIIRICRGGKFTFDFTISPSYPHEAPKVLCLTKVRYGAIGSTLRHIGYDNVCRRNAVDLGLMVLWWMQHYIFMAMQKR